MKKMILAAAIICAAAFAHAGSVSWSTVAMYNDANAKVKATATMYVYMLADAESYNAMTDVWAAYGADVQAGGLNAANSGGTKTASLNSKVTVNSPNGSAEANTTYYAALIVTIGTGDDMKYYAEKQSVLTGDDGNGAFTTFGSGTLNTAASAATAWQSVSVPEPTSGLLLLVGGALLALRRKQK